MGDMFSALSSGLARFVYAWLLPSVLTVAVFVLVVWPQFELGLELGTLGGAAALLVAALALSVLFAYGSRPIFQIFEGYTLPRCVQSRLLRRQQRRFIRLQVLAAKAPIATVRNQAAEALRGFPDQLQDVLPTSMGNALRGLETYGSTRYGLDSQAFWYELQATSPDKAWRGLEEAQSAVDFFMSSLTHLILLATACLVLAPWAANPVPVLLTTALSLFFCPLLYHQTVDCIREWRYAVQAVVNLGRPALADGLGFELPQDYYDERDMWIAAYDFVVDGPTASSVHVLNSARRRFR